MMALMAGLIFFWNAWKRWTPEVLPEIRGRLEQPLFGSPQLVITLWHQHPGNLHRGQFKVTLTSGLSSKPNGVDTQIHSFETWEPNEDHQKSFVFPLRAMDPAQELPLEFSLEAKEIKPATLRHSWQGNGWKPLSGSPSE